MNEKNDKTCVVAYIQKIHTYPQHINRKIFDQCVLLVLMYRYQTWAFIKGKIKRITKKQRSTKGKMLNVNLSQKQEQMDKWKVKEEIARQ